VGVPVMVVVGQWWQGEREEQGLYTDAMYLARIGEPMNALDFFKQSKAGEVDNAAPLLQGAASSIDELSEAWCKLERLELRLPLTRRESAAVECAQEKNRPALAMMTEARGKHSARWNEYFESPMRETRCQRLREQGRLVQLLEGQLLFSHQRGDDRQAFQSVSDLLMVSRATEQMLPGFSHPAAAAMSSTACNRLIDISPDLRIGSGEGAVAREAVLELIRALADESILVEGHLRHLRWVRASHAEMAHALFNERLWTKQMRPPSLPWQAVMLWDKPTAMVDSRVILKLSTEVIRAAEASEDAPGFAMTAANALTRIQEVDREADWRPGVLSYQWYVQKHYLLLAERRLAATALAIRLYVVDHGSIFPKTLEALTPEYLAAVPADPMARKSSRIKYVADESVPRIYSIGENGHDDGGSDAMQSDRATYDRIQAEDVVAHLKIQKRKNIERDEDETLNLFSGRFGGGAGADGGGSTQGGN
jgi:hypothetical protein